jgi:hypothetical protein
MAKAKPETQAVVKTEPAQFPAIPVAAFKAQLTRDWAGVSDEDKVRFASSVCKALDIPTPLNPFTFIPMKGKMTFYAGKEAAELLAERNKISVNITNKYLDKEQNIYVVECRAQMPTVDYYDKKGVKTHTVHGRSIDNLAAISMHGKSGDDRANALMKAVTKAQRRTVFSAVGLSIMDAEPDENGGAQARTYEVPPAVISPVKAASMMAQGTPATAEENELAAETIEARSLLFKRLVARGEKMGLKAPDRVKRAISWVVEHAGTGFEFLSAVQCADLNGILDRLEEEESGQLTLDETLPPPPKGDREPGSEG